MKKSLWKSIDMAAYSLLLVGALNWGFVGILGVDLVAMLLGSMSVLSRGVYILVGLAALYDLLSLPAILKRWDINIHHHATPAHV